MPTKRLRNISLNSAEFRITIALQTNGSHKGSEKKSNDRAEAKYGEKWVKKKGLSLKKLKTRKQSKEMSSTFSTTRNNYYMDAITFSVQR